ncbi:MAG TPA: Dam family site-specific DNA-(adenine-N6)-methyltransferase [Vicinamibacterales bacterium]|jgi:DNA adenine methylase|nr:Dam family site-specific DNA-(adenine-N6)-methyltransferase [Vicinamibacterales bacterium]
MRASIPTVVRPLLKWAGGKRQLLPVLAEHYPPRFSRYIEPFMGSAAVFFDLLNSGRLARKAIVLADVNPDLIGCYRMLRDRPEAVIRALQALAREYRSGGSDSYYDVRDTRFNPLRAALQGRAFAPGDVADMYTPGLAAMLIFLNRTGFNGLFRLNRQGGFNVPAGRYTNPRICDETHLRSVAVALASPGVTIALQSFDRTLDDASAGDFVYCDPPYAPVSRTSSFANYTAEGFTAFDQRRLQQKVVAACKRGAHVVVSNSSAAEILSAYTTTEAQRAGLQVRPVPARRAINSKASSRGPINELIITNVKAAALATVKPRMARSRLNAKRKYA